MGSLFGGNQQKILLSRWLEICRIIDELARRAVGIVVISSEMPEIIGVCDRVLVMR